MTSIHSDHKNNLKKRLRNLVLAVAPDLALKILSIRSRRSIERQCSENGTFNLSTKVLQFVGGAVASGPFKGMVLDIEAFPQNVSPKLLGTYESEISSEVTRFCARQPDLVINVGSAEGYYAVGLARLLPDAKVIAFDADPKAQSAVRRNAALNRVEDRLSVRGILHVGELETLLRGSARPLVVSDCEGGEELLLDPAKCPALERADMLVELHADTVEGIVSTMRLRFCATHDVTLIDPISPEFKLQQAQGLIDDHLLASATNEWRGGYTPWGCFFSKRPEVKTP